MVAKVGKTLMEWLTPAGALLALIIGVANIIKDLRKAKTDYNQSNIKSLEDLSKQVNQLIQDKINMQEHNDRLDARIEALELDVRRWKNAYARAIKYIYDKDPLTPIPNFLDSDPNIYGIRK